MYIYFFILQAKINSKERDMDFGLLNWSDQWMMWTGEKGSRDLLSAEEFLISMQHNDRAKHLEIFIKLI